jgi:UDP-3-O-[3-hydroxymyristoyl] glucosamine N-acyltransferase
MKMEKKYKLTDETIKIDDVTLYRIEALKDFGKIKKGDKGGFVQSEKNLSQKGNCWIYDDACAFDDAIVKDNAHLYNNSVVFGNARVYENAHIHKSASIFNDAKVYGHACVTDRAVVFETADIYGYGYVCDNAQVYGNAYVFEFATIGEYAKVFGTALGNARIRGNACVRGGARVTGDAIVYDDAIIEDYCVVRGNACIGGNVTLKKREDYVTFYEWWSRYNRIITWTRPNNMWRVGTFYGTAEELVKQAYKDNEKFGRQYEHFMKSIEAIIKEEDGEEI